MDARADRFTYVSPSVEKLRGYTPAEVLAQPASEALTPESAILVRDALKKRLAEILATGTVAPSYVSEVDQPRKDGSIVHTEVTTTYVLNPDGRVEVIGVSRDITGRKRAELLLVESEARFRTFVEESTDGLAISDEQGLVIEWNPALEKILGIPREQALTLALWDIQSQMLLPENRSAERLDLFRKNLLEAITSGQSPYFGRSYEAVVQTKSGERKVVQQSSFPIKTNKGYRIGAILRDITQKKQAEAALTESEERFRSIYETTGLGIFESTADGQALDVNPAYARMFGFETPEAARQGLADIAGSIYVHPEKREQFVQYVLEHPGLASFENEYRRCDGTTFTGELKLQAMQAVDGQSPHLFGYVEDITERKQAQEKIARAEKRFKSLIENAPDGIVMVGLDGKYKYASPAALRMFNYTRQDVEGGNPVEQTHPEDLTLVLETLQDLIANPSLVPTLQYRFLHKSGSWLWIESTFTNLLAEPSVEAIVINFRDVTERVDAEKQIRASEENSRLAHDAADLGTWQEDLLNHTFILDERARKHYDQDNSHLATAEITSRVFPADVPRLQAAITAILEPVTNGRLELEYRVIHRDGSIHWLAVHTRVHFENRNGVRTAVMAVGTSQDITERKDAEEKLTRRTRQLRLIHEATHRLNVSLDVRHVHEVIYANVSQLMPCDTLFISTFDPASRMITLAGGWHDGSPVDLTPYEPILLEPEGSGIQSQVIRTKEPQSIPDYQARLKKTQVVHHFDGDGQPVDEPPEDADIPRSALMVPLLAEGQVLGVIQVFSYRLNAYTEDDLQILAGFSAQAAIALSNARLYGHVQQENLERKRAEASLLTRTRQLGSLFDIADHLGNVQSEEQALTVVTAEMESLMEAQASGIALLEPDHGHFKLVRATDALVSNLGRRFSMEEGISGWVLQEGRVRIIADYPSDPLRLEGVTGIEDMGPGLFAPIRTESQFAGVLFVLRRKDIDTQPFDENAARLLTAVGEIMGGTLQRVRLFEQTTSQLNQLQTLHKIDRAITGSLDLGLTLRLLLTEITSQPEVDAADILLVNPHNLTLEYAASNGFRTRAVEQMHLLIGQGYAGLTALRREPLHVRDLHNCDEPLRRQIVKEEGFKAYIAAPLIAKGKIVGVLEFYARSTQDYGPDWDNFIETLANQATIAIENARLFTDLQRSNLEMELAFDATLEGWSRAVDLHAHETEGHSSRVAEIAIDLAQAMGMHNEDLIQLRRGALLHDIGKLAIPDEILLKPGPLTDGEWEVIRRHPIIAHEILQSVEYLRGALVIPYCHHENWDGTGYPRRMAGEQIPLAARIFAVADVYETLISDRPYRSAWERRKALAHIEEQAGRQFDPHVVDAFRTWFNTR
jgi:PAS domain S-box-containing protein